MRMRNSCFSRNFNFIILTLKFLFFTLSWIYINFTKRDDHKSMPRWMLKALRFLRVS